MQAKRFIAADMRRALDMVKTEFGEEAMILSTERTAKGVELVATAEPSVALSDPLAANEAIASKSAQEQKVASAASQFRAQTNVPQYETKPAPVTAPPHYNNTTQTTGIASGKTKEELAQELEIASRKMMAAKKANTMTLEGMTRQASNPAESIHTQPAQALNSEPTQNAPVSVNHQKDIQRLHTEIADMRQHLQVQLSQMANIQERQLQVAQQPAMSDIQEVTPVALEVRQHLNQLGLTKACNDQVMAAIRTDHQPDADKQLVWTEALAQLSRHIPYDTSDITAKGGIYAFLGTTGVGKTTTIAKLAARYVMANGGDKVILLTTDNYRIASHNQLRSLARILGIKMQVVEALEQLPNLLDSLTDYDLVLIDTPGMSYSDPLLKPHIKSLKQVPRLKNILVVSASSQYQMMKASVHAYRSVGLQGCVLTKLDECVSLGDAMSMLSEHTIPLVYMTDGQSVPNDLSVMKSSQLVARAVNTMKLRKEQQLKAQKSI